MVIGARTSAVVGVALAGTVLAGCGGTVGGGGSDDSSTTLKIGFVSTTTGSLAAFGEANTFVVDEMKAYFKKNPVKVGGTTYAVDIIVRDAQSDSTRPARSPVT